MRRAGIINAGAHSGPSHPALATTAARQSVAGNRCGISGFSGRSRNPARMSASVYDLPALERLMRRLNGGEIQISDVTTTTPSPFATSLLFGYVAEFMYQERHPLAERRASVLSLDSELLRNLLGQVDPGIYSTRRSFARWKKCATTGSWQKSER